MGAEVQPHRFRVSAADAGMGKWVLLCGLMELHTQEPGLGLRLAGGWMAGVLAVCITARPFYVTSTYGCMHAWGLLASCSACNCHGRCLG
jgi:hypothetical protein